MGTGFAVLSDAGDPFGDGYAAFSNEHTEVVTMLVSKYHDDSAPGGRVHRVTVVAHPLPRKSDPKEPS